MKKKALSISALLVIMMLAFSGCSKADNSVPSGDTPGQAEAPTESVQNTEPEATPTATPEAINYSPEAVMKLVDELIVKYPYNKPEHIKALVIAGNLDYISKEDMDVILGTYGYTIEDLSKLYDECILESNNVLSESGDYSQGNLDSLPPERTYENRIRLSDTLINTNDAVFAQQYDEMLISRSVGLNIMDADAEFHETVINSTSFSNIESFVYCYTIGVLHPDISYTDFVNNPFTTYQSKN